MRNFLLFLLQGFIFISYTASAQQKRQVNPGPGTDPGPVGQPAGELFVGNWEWSYGGEVFHITLTRNPASQDPQDPKHRVMNVVTGQHRYTRNGVVIEQSYTGSPAPYSMLCVPVDNTSLNMSFYDLTKNRHGNVTLTFIPGNWNQLTWQLKPKEMIYIYPDVAPSPGFTVPTNVTLTRVP